MEQVSAFSSRSLDVVSIFTNFLLDEKTDISVIPLFENTNNCEGFAKSEHKYLFFFATNESCLISNGLLYKQIHGAANGLPLKHFYANVCLSYHKKPG